MYIKRNKGICSLKTLRSLLHTCASFINFSDAGLFLFIFKIKVKKWQIYKFEWLEL